jgi:hypothetical protein
VTAPSLGEIVAAFTRVSGDVAGGSPSLGAQADQASADAAVRLREEFGVDVTDAEQARVAAAVALFALLAGSRSLGRPPLSSVELLGVLAATNEALNAVGFAVAGRHGREGGARV